MTPRRSVLPVICFALVFWASSVISQELTTRSAFGSSFVVDSTLYGQVGSFRDSYIHEDTLILSTKSGLVIFNLTSYDWLDPATNITQGARTMFFATGGFVPITPYYDAVRNRIIIASESTNNPLLGLIDFTTLKLIPSWQLVNETASNPKSASSLAGVFSVVASDSYLYYASAR